MVAYCLVVCPLENWGMGVDGFEFGLKNETVLVDGGTKWVVTIGFSNDISSIEMTRVILLGVVWWLAHKKVKREVIGLLVLVVELFSEFGSSHWKGWCTVMMTV